jgi:protein O-mannosyl-transferase
MAKQRPSKQVQNTKPSTENLPNVTSKINLWIPSLILGILAFLIYANTFGHGYALDDYSVIKDNYITKRGLAGIGEHMTSEYRKGYWNSAGTLYRPLSLVMFAIEWHISPDKPFLGHFMNVLLYAITAIVLFRFLTKILVKYPIWVSFFIVALFVAHPIHTEIVANIKSRDEILSFLFSILTTSFLFQYANKNNTLHLFLAIFTYTIALFSKESAITFLAIFPLVIALFGENFSLKKLFVPVAAMLLPTALFFICRYQVLGAQIGIEHVSPLDSMIAAQSSVFDKKIAAICMAGYYLKTLFLPVPLVSDLGYNQVQISGLGDWKVLLSAFSYLALLIFASVKIFQKNLISFGIFFALITFSISSNIFITIGTGYGERLAYAPSFGFAIAIIGLLYHLFNENEEILSSFLPKNIVVTLVTSLIVIVFSILTFLRNPAWENSFSLYESDIQSAPNCAKLNYHYALELTKKGRDDKNNAMIDKAIVHFGKALEIYPKYGDAYGEMGLAYFYKGDQDQALAYYTKASELQPDAKVWSNMGMIFFNKGNLPEAQKVYEKSVALDPKFVDARRNLGSTYAMQGRFKEAIVQFHEAIKYAPDQAVLYFFLGSAYKDSGDVTNAQRFLDKAYQMQPSLKK